MSRRLFLSVAAAARRKAVSEGAMRAAVKRSDEHLTGIYCTDTNRLLGVRLNKEFESWVPSQGKKKRLAFTKRVKGLEKF